MTRRNGLLRHAVGLALVGGLCLGPSLLVTPALADEPKLTPQQEWEAHPELVKAVRSMEAALADLDRAPHDFGGNKFKAITDIKTAIHSLKKAIFYRLQMDDAAIDKAQVK